MPSEEREDGKGKRNGHRRKSLAVGMCPGKRISAGSWGVTKGCRSLQEATASLLWRGGVKRQEGEWAIVLETSVRSTPPPTMKPTPRMLYPRPFRLHCSIREPLPTFFLQQFSQKGGLICVFLSSSHTADAASSAVALPCGRFWDALPLSMCSSPFLTSCVADEKADACFAPFPLRSYVHSYWKTRVSVGCVPLSLFQPT